MSSSFKRKNRRGDGPNAQVRIKFDDGTNSAGRDASSSSASVTAHRHRAPETDNVMDAALFSWQEFFDHLADQAVDTGYLTVAEMQELARSRGRLHDGSGDRGNPDEEDIYMTIGSVAPVQRLAANAVDAGYLTVSEMRRLVSGEADYLTLGEAAALAHSAADAGYLTVDEARQLLSRGSRNGGAGGTVSGAEYMAILNAKAQASAQSQDTYMDIDTALGRVPGKDKLDQQKETGTGASETDMSAKAAQDRWDALMRKVEEENEAKRAIFIQEEKEAKEKAKAEAKQAKLAKKTQAREDELVYKEARRRMTETKKQLKEQRKSQEASRSRSKTAGRVDLMEVQRRSAMLAAGLRETNTEQLKQEQQGAQAKWESQPAWARLRSIKTIETATPGFVSTKRGDRLVALELDIGGYHKVQNLRTNLTGLIPGDAAVSANEYEAGGASSRR